MLKNFRLRRSRIRDSSTRRRKSYACAFPGCRCWRQQAAELARAIVAAVVDAVATALPQRRLLFSGEALRPQAERVLKEDTVTPDGGMFSRHGVPTCSSNHRQGHQFASSQAGPECKKRAVQTPSDTRLVSASMVGSRQIAA
jgi:hypothetical protein